MIYPKRGDRIVVNDQGEIEYWFGGYTKCVIHLFTGLLDKNGKEIYDRDIIRAIRVRRTRSFGRINLKYDEMILEVYFDYETASFRFHNPKMQWSAPYGIEDNYEVIGNAYEHHHLLVDNK